MRLMNVLGVLAVVALPILALTAVDARAQNQEDLDRWQEMWGRAQELFGNQEWEQAADLYVELADELPPTVTLKNASYYNAACCYSFLGNKADACYRFAQAVKTGFVDLEHIGSDTDLDPIRDEEMFKHVVGILERQDVLGWRQMDPAALRAQYYGSGPDSGSGDMSPELQRLRERLLKEMDDQLDRMREDMVRAIDEALQEFANGGATTPTDPDPTPPQPSGPKPWLGFSAKPLPDSMRALLELQPDEGLLITGVEAGSPADKAGLMADDVVLLVNDAPIGSKTALRNFLSQAEIGDTLSITILRQGERAKLQLTIEKKPD